MHRALPVPQVEDDAELVEVTLLGIVGDIPEVLPERPIAGPPLLELEGGLPGTLGLGGIGLGTGRHRRIHLLQVVEGEGRLGRIGPGRIRHRSREGRGGAAGPR